MAWNITVSPTPLPIFGTFKGMSSGVKKKSLVCWRVEDNKSNFVEMIEKSKTWKSAGAADKSLDSGPEGPRFEYVLHHAVCSESGARELPDAFPLNVARINVHRTGAR